MLKFIGTGSAFNEEMGNTSAYIKNEDTLFVLDCGETAFARMKQLNLFDDVKNVYIAITHMHPDHVGSLGSLIFYLNIFKNITPTLVITNEDSAEAQEDTLRNFLSIVGVDEDKYDFSYADMLEDVLPGLKRVELVEINHSKNLTSYAIELYFKNQTIYYVGDNNDKEYLSLVEKQLKPEDLVYTDCTNEDYEGRVHIMLSELAGIFPENKRPQVYCMHFGSYEVYSKAKEYGFKVVSKELSIEELLKQIANRK